MLESPCEHLLEKPYLHLEEITVFLWDEFEVLVSTQHITSLSSRESTEKVLLAGSIR
jgi:hypothetical protein